jgi:hypothetical protein
MEFLKKAFSVIRAKFPPEPDQYSLNSISSAVYILQCCAGIDRSYLGKRLGLTHTQMVNLESRGKPINRELLERLRLIAEDYNLVRLSEYFSNQILLIQNRQRGKMRKQTTGQ